MILLIEGYRYKADDVKDLLEGLGLLENLNQEVVVNYVGYMYSPHVKDCIFILPKVLIDENEQAFGHINPTDIIHLDKATALTEEERRFIYEFAVWIYRALYVFNTNNPDNDIVFHKQMTKVGNNHRHVTNTFLEVLLALVDFNKRNQNFFMMVLRNLHSGNNKINWTKTISRSQAFVQDDEEPIYLDPVNKKRQINFDEELLIIFFSILQYLKERYGFPVKIQMGYELIQGEQFKRYINGYGQIRLRQIKYKYFSDKTLYLWELCFAFFERSHQIAVTSSLQEYLVAKNFNIVFEAIIDELIGDKDIPDGLKEQPDGKIVDHLYSYKSLTTIDKDKKDVFYIGDSKYYKLGNDVGENSVYKQFTYARNVIQWNMNLFLSDKDSKWKKKVSKYRDETTEGYNIVPNFFISARMDKDLSYDDKVYETQKQKKFHIQRHFENRLFDRDTLLVYHYDVNFLFIVSLYAQNDDSAKLEWKGKVKELFRREIQKMLTEQYSFYAMQAHPNVDAKTYLKEHFQQTLGKIFTPFGNDEVFSLALDKKDPDGTNEDLLAELRKHFFVVDNGIGTNPDEKIRQIIIREGSKYAIDKTPGQKCLMFNLLGDQYISSERKLSEDNRFGIAIQSDEGHNVLHLEEGMASIAYLVITNKRECKVYYLEKSPVFLTGQDCKGILSTKKDALVYLVFKVAIPTAEVSKILSDMVDINKVKSIYGAGHGIKMLDFDFILKEE